MKLGKMYTDPTLVMCGLVIRGEVYQDWLDRESSDVTTTLLTDLIVVIQRRLSPLSVGVHVVNSKNCFELTDQPGFDGARLCNRSVMVPFELVHIPFRKLLRRSVNASG